MSVEIKEYIESGALEAYLMGSSSDQETDELLSLKAQYPEISYALNDIEKDLEHIARNMAISPPPGTWLKIEDQINELTTQPEFKELKITSVPKKNGHSTKNNSNDFVEVHGPSSHMRVHKIWRWILAAIFVLGKVFLGFAIYYYLESKQAHEQIAELKQELKYLKTK